MGDENMQGTQTLPKTLELDGIQHNVSDLSTQSQKFLKVYLDSQAIIAEREKLEIILTRAKNSYLQELKQEILTKKAGLEFTV
jgi:hypothetical protein